MSRAARRSQRLGAVVVPALLAGAVGSAGLAAPATASAPRADPGTIPGAWIVTLEDGASPDAVADDHRRDHGARVDHIYRHALSGYAARMSDEVAAKVAGDTRVATVQRDRAVAIAGKPVKDGGGGTQPDQTVPTGINRVDAELSTHAGTSVDVDVAVLDTGIAAHPDLNIAGGYNCTGGRKSAYSDGNGHGTHVAGTIAAKDDAGGVVGVAPGARLWAVKVLSDSGSGSWSGVVCGVDWVTGKGGIEVANMSLGGGGSDPDDGVVGNCATGNSLHDAICKSVAAGTTYAVAAGNSAANASGFVPAAYDEVITVSALADFDGEPGGAAKATCRADEDDTFANFSNYGADVDLIAPGVCINSTWLSSGFNTISGTSMASPHVAGAAALYKAGNTLASPETVKGALQSAGNLDWDNSDDPDPKPADSTVGDPLKEKLLNVAAF